MNLVTPEFGLIFWQVITFAIVFFLLAKFAWKPITSALQEREDTIQLALDSAVKAKEEMSKMLAANENLLQEARLERDKILKDAQVAGANMVNEAKDKALAEGTRLLENARLSINTEKQMALAEVKNQAAALSIQIAEKLLKRELSNDTAQKELVSDYIKEANFN